ncbi:hypothetical protein D3C81_434020 [compost metagenome]
MSEPHMNEHPVAAPIEVPDEMTYEQALAFSQRVRRTIVREKLKGGVPSDLDEVKLVLSALKDHDTTAINDRKNTIEEGVSQSSADVASNMVELIKMMKNENPFSRAPDGSAPADHTPRAILPNIDESKLGDHELVDGEGLIGTVQETSESFFGRMGINPSGKGKDD